MTLQIKQAANGVGSLSAKRTTHNPKFILVASSIQPAFGEFLLDGAVIVGFVAGLVIGGWI